MTRFTAISKSIGWVPPTNPLIYPSVKATEILMEGVLEKDELSFYNVFKLHRFLASPRDGTEVLVMDIIYKSFIAGVEIWKNIEIPEPEGNPYD